MDSLRIYKRIIVLSVLMLVLAENSFAQGYYPINNLPRDGYSFLRMYVKNGKDYLAAIYKESNAVYMAEPYKIPSMEKIGVKLALGDLKMLGYESLQALADAEIHKGEVKAFLLEFLASILRGVRHPPLEQC